MNYKIRKEDLQNDLLAETLQALFHCYNQLQLPLYVVGASARDIALRLLNVANTPRRTLDLDVAVALHDWKQYEELSQVLLRNHFTKAQEKHVFSIKVSEGTIGLKWILCRLEPSPRKNRSRGLPKVHLSCLFGVSRM